MNPESYIASGILELYALDQLDLNEREEVERMIAVFPEIRAELEQIQSALEKYAASHPIQPHPRVGKKIQDSISNLEKEKEMDPANLPLISKFSDHTKWLDLVKDMIPGTVPKGDIFTKTLQKSEKALQLLIVAAADIPDETHEDSHESFLILKGRCKCTVADEVRYMEPGDYMAIPLYEHHDVEILTEDVVAILQRVRVEEEFY